MMRVQIEFVGEPFDRAAALHILRHLALRVGWTLTTQTAPRKILYVTDAQFDGATAPDDAVVIWADGQARERLQNSSAPIPLAPNTRLPFARTTGSFWPNVIPADVVAGAYAALNLWYETRTRVAANAGWLKWREDWWARSGFDNPLPLADEWLDEIARAAVRLGWMREVPRANFLNAPFVVVLTHDVDYLPGKHDFGLPRFVRALARQIVLRKNFGDAIRLAATYARAWRRNPFDTLCGIAAAEEKYNARSSFQFVARGTSSVDPTYRIASDTLKTELRALNARGWEICLHGSYASSRVADALAQEKRLLEKTLGAPVWGQRHHYLNFYPPQLFEQVARAGLQYDLSVGYNDRSGARAGTLFPYRPFGYAFWEIPFVLMDTTLATTYRLSAAEAETHAKRVLRQLVDAGGCAAIIWHAEQSSGVLDPGYERVYENLLEWIYARGGALVSGRALLRELDDRWRAAWADDYPVSP